MIATRDLADVRTTRRWGAGDAAAALAVVWVVAGAMLAGLASCGAPGWQAELIHAGAVALGAITAALPSRMLHTWPRKALFLGMLLVGYLGVEAASAPFYPGPPAGVSAYIDQLILVLQRGPCG